MAQTKEAIATLYASPLRRAWQTAESIGEALSLRPVPHDGLKEINERHLDQKVVVVAHGGTLRACLVHYLPAEFGQWWTYELGNCSLTRLEVGEGRAKLLVLDDHAHLAE